MKYVNMYYAERGGYVTGSKMFDSAAAAAEKGAKSPNFAMVLPYVSKAERSGEPCCSAFSQEDASLDFDLDTYQELVVEDGTHRVITTSGDSVKILDMEDPKNVFIKVGELAGVGLVDSTQGETGLRIVRN